MGIWKRLFAFLTVLFTMSCLQTAVAASYPDGPPLYCDVIFALTGMVGKVFGFVLIVSAFAARFVRKMTWKRAFKCAGAFILLSIIFNLALDLLKTNIYAGLGWTILLLQVISIGIAFALLVRKVPCVGLLVLIGVILVFGVATYTLVTPTIMDGCGGSWPSAFRLSNTVAKNL